MRAVTWSSLCEGGQTYLTGLDRPITKAYENPWRAICGIKRTEPSSRRLRFPFGRRGASVLGWTCTRAEMMAGPFLEPVEPLRLWHGKDPSKNAPDILLAVWDFRVHSVRQLRQGWDKYGEAMALGEVR